MDTTHQPQKEDAPSGSGLGEEGEGGSSSLLQEQQEHASPVGQDDVIDVPIASDADVDAAADAAVSDTVGSPTTLSPTTEATTTTTVEQSHPGMIHIQREDANNTTNGVDDVCGGGGEIDESYRIGDLVNVGSFDIVAEQEQQQAQQHQQEHPQQQQQEEVYQVDQQFVDTSSSIEDHDEIGDKFDDVGVSLRHQTQSIGIDDSEDLDDEEHVPLIELGEETMAQAMLIFLLADLRILSATGRIRTKFEHLCLDSDHSPRISSLDFAGFYDYISDESSSSSIESHGHSSHSSDEDDDSQESFSDHKYDMVDNAAVAAGSAATTTSASAADHAKYEYEEGVGGRRDEHHVGGGDGGGSPSVDESSPPPTTKPESHTNKKKKEEGEEENKKHHHHHRRPRVKKNKTHGITASHIMAVLLVEILREAEDAAKLGAARHYKPELLSPWDIGDTDKYASNTARKPRNAKKVFQRDIRAANGMPSLLHCYNEMLSEDVSPNISRVSRTLYPLDEDMEEEEILQSKIQQMTMKNNNNTNTSPSQTASSQPPSGGYPPPLNNLQYVHNSAESTGGVSLHSGSVGFANVVLPETPNSNNNDYFYQSDRVSEDDSLWSRECATDTKASAKQMQPILDPPKPVSTSALQTTTTKPISSRTIAVTSATAVPAIPKPKPIKPRSHSMSVTSVFENQKSDGMTVTSRHSSQSRLNMGNFPNQTSYSNRPHRSGRRRSITTSNFQVSHFNPNVDIRELMEDDDNGDYKLHNKQLKLKERRHQTKEKLREMLQETLQQHAPSIAQHKLAQRILPTSPNDDIAKIAGVQNQLLNWTINVETTNHGDGTDNVDDDGDDRKPPGIVSSASSLSSGSPEKLPQNTSVAEEVGTVESSLLEKAEQQQLERPSSPPDVEATITTAASDTAVGTKTTSSDISSSAGGAKQQKQEKMPQTTKPHTPPDVKRTDSLLKQREHHKSNQQQFHDSLSIRQLIIQALDKRDFWRLGFIKTFFREGTVSHVLANSSAEMVWLSDWHTQYECTYAISIDRAKNKVLLAFRGAYTESDWKHIVDWYDTATSNPVKDYYPNRATNIRLHSGFHKYLFRVRKDTNTTKYDEIAAKLSHYCKMTNSSNNSDNRDSSGTTNNRAKPLRITITGHSLGAALATIFSLYASTEERFTGKNNENQTSGCIECVTFGAPFIGNWRFAGAVKHQENVGKLRIAKFHVKGDSVPHLPPALVRTSSHGAQYWHSGIDISLPYIRNKFFKAAMFGYQPKPKLTYHDPDSEGYIGSLIRQFREYYVWNLPLRFWRFALFHTLVEHKKRMALVSKQDKNSLLTTCSLKQLYEVREELTERARSTRRRLKYRFQENNNNKQQKKGGGENGKQK